MERHAPLKVAIDLHQKRALLCLKAHMLHLKQRQIGLVYAYFSAYKVPAVIVRCSNIFGPYQHTEKVIPLFITNALEEKELPIHGDRKSIREWTPVNDLCRVIDLTLHTPSIEGQAFNIGSGIEKNINEIASMILTLTGKPNTLIRYVNQRQSVVRRHAVSAKKIKEILGVDLTIDFLVALENTVNWYKKNVNWWKNSNADSLPNEPYATSNLIRKM